MQASEYNFDGLIGPTHNYGGLAYGNIPSQINRYAVSNPRQAALQGIRKMRLLMSLGIKQGFLPPQPRPDIKALYEHGFHGTERQILEKVSSINFDLLVKFSSASSMWSANAATVCPSADAQDERLHITPANLISQEHRAIEARQTAVILKNLFPQGYSFNQHPPLPAEEELSDEGAANHMRLCEKYPLKGLQIFVYGKSADLPAQDLPQRYPARQSLKASQTIALTHQCDKARTMFVRQNPQAIDRGVFHNDVIATANENVLFFHQESFVEQKEVLRVIKEKFSALSRGPLYLLEVKSDQLSIKEAAAAYLFNAQLVSVNDGAMVLIAPEECQEKRIQEIINKILMADNPVKKVYYVNLRQSMQNGGGPACLRLRIVLNEREQSFINTAYILDEEKTGILEAWVKKHYREQLRLDDLRDYSFVQESYTALDELTKIFQLGSIYPFQQ